MDSLLLLVGIFDAESVHTDSGQQAFSSALTSWMGREVTVHLHHFPQGEVDPDLPGGGSCMWNGHCPHGHQERPGWLFQQTLTGVLSLSDGKASVGGVHIRFDMMEGHHGRLLLWGEEKPDRLEDASFDDLLADAAQMQNLLEALKKVL